MWHIGTFITHSPALASPIMAYLPCFMAGILLYHRVHALRVSQAERLICITRCTLENQCETITGRQKG